MKKVVPLFPVLAAVFFCCLVPAKAAKKPKTSAKKAPGFDALIKKAINEGWDHSFRTGRAADLEVPDRSPGKELGVEETESSDDSRHSVDAVFDPSSSTPTVRCLVFILGHSYPEKLEGVDYIFRASATGVLQKAFSTVGKYDGQGHVVPGSGITSFKNINSGEVKKQYQHELEFWLEGKHRKNIKGPSEKNAP